MKTSQKSITNAKVQPCRYPELAREISIRLPGGVDYPAGQLLQELNANAQGNEVQTLTVGASGGTFTLTYTGFGTTAAIAFNVSTANLQAALDAVIGAGNVVVTGASTPYTLTYANEFANRHVEVPAMNTSALTGGGTNTCTEATQGAVGKVGEYSSYTGTGIAKAILGRRTKTDSRGAIIDEFGNTNNLTTTAWNGGDFLCSELTGLDASALAGRFQLTDGGTSADTGAVVRLR